MAVQNRSSSRRIFKWECNKVEVVPVSVKTSEYLELLARVSEELYPLINQLPDRSNSLNHPGQPLEPQTAAIAAEHEGVCDGNESIQKAA